MVQAIILNQTATYEDQNATTAEAIMHYLWITLDIFKVIAMLALIIIDLFLVLIFIKSKQLLKSPMHKYILLFLIANFLFIMFYPVSSGYIFDVHPFWETQIYCSAYQVQHSFLFQIFIFGALPGIEWYLTFHKPKWHQKLKSNHSMAIWMLFCAILLHFSVNLWMCFQSTCVFKDYGIMVTFAIASLLMTALCYFKFATGPLSKDAQDRAYYLSISIYIVMPWIPNFIINLIFYFLDDFSLFYRFIVAMNVVADYMAYSTPLTVLFVLYKRNPEFQWELKNIFKRNAGRIDNELGATVNNRDESDNRQTSVA